MAEQRGFTVAHEYSDIISGTKARRPALDAMMTAARGAEFDVVLVWASDRLARSVRHFLEVLDELNRLGIEFVSSEKTSIPAALGSCRHRHRFGSRRTRAQPHRRTS